MRFLVKKILFTSLFFALSTLGMAQFFSPGFYPGGYYNRFGYNPNSLFNMPFVTSESAGNFFWDEEWHLGRAVLKSEQVIEGYKFRYDLGNNRLEVLVNNEINMLPLKQVKYLEWVEENEEVSFFVNGFDYQLDGVGLVGLLNVLTTGSVQLVMKRDVQFSRSNYVSGFSSARSVERGNSRMEFFLLEGKQLLPLSKKTKDNLPYFKPFENEIKQFVKQEKLNWKKGNNLIKIVSHYNQLLSDKS